MFVLTWFMFITQLTRWSKIELCCRARDFKRMFIVLSSRTFPRTEGCGLIGVRLYLIIKLFLVYLKRKFACWIKQIVILSFLHPTFNLLPFISSGKKKRQAHLPCIFRENKSFMLHTFARKTKVSSYKRLPRLLLQWIIEFKISTKIIVKRHSKIYSDCEWK